MRLLFALFVLISMISCGEQEVKLAEVKESKTKLNNEKLSREDALLVLTNSGIYPKPVTAKLPKFYEEDASGGSEIGNSINSIKSLGLILTPIIYTQTYRNSSTVDFYRYSIELTTEGKKYFIEKDRWGNIEIKLYDLVIDNISGLMEELPGRKVKAEYTLRKDNSTPFSQVNFMPFNSSHVAISNGLNIQMKGTAILNKYDDGWRVEK